ncbi:hypothetical protein BFG51_11770 [Dietzia alimentaria]|nr:HAD family phosphatase [Dietzia sp. E1]ODQ97090.1 hypothetical protein BFG51_11770 [Dietzia alimentaria]
MLMPSRGGAVLWDLDGTLIDSEASWAHACAQLSRELGAHPWDPEPAEISGISIPGLADLLRERGARSERRVVVKLLAERMEDLNRRDGVLWRPGALDLLETLQRAGVCQGLVTMSPSRTAATVLEQLPHPYFADVTTADMVTRPKPDPEAYRTALRNLRVSGSQSVAIEDSTIGVHSARGAGLRVIAVRGSQPVEAQDGIQVWESFRHRGIDDVIAAGLRL